MKTSLLLVSTNTRWYGPARIPRSLDDAGFEVSLLAPAGSLAEKSRFIAAVAKGFGMTGFFSLECVVDRNSGVPYLLEINRRIVANTHRGSAYDVDPCKALHAALHGLPLPTRADFDEGEEHIGVHFPQEWLRDPDSTWLRDYAVDVPWEEPELIEAMVALRREG